MAVHWKPSSTKVPQADYRSMSQWYESNRYREIVGSGARETKVGQFTFAQQANHAIVQELAESVTTA